MSDASHTEGEPTLDDLLAKAVQDELEAYHGALPCAVTLYTPADQTADVRPLIRVAVDGELHAPPTLRRVPVRWPATATHSMVLPLSVGDVGWAIPAGGDISQWHAHGTELATEAELRRFDLSDCFFTPGSRSLVSPLAASAYHATWAVLAGQWMIGSSAATKAAGLDGDSVEKDNITPDSMAQWMAQVETALNTLATGSVAPPSTTFTKVGTLTATAAKLKAE